MFERQGKVVAEIQERFSDVAIDAMKPSHMTCGQPSAFLSERIFHLVNQYAFFFRTDVDEDIRKEIKLVKSLLLVRNGSGTQMPKSLGDMAAYLAEKAGDSPYFCDNLRKLYTP